MEDITIFNLNIIEQKREINNYLRIVGHINYDYFTNYTLNNLPLFAKLVFYWSN